MYKTPLMLFLSGVCLLVFLFTGIKLGIDESHRRHRLSYKIKQRTRRLQAFFGLT